MEQLFSPFRVINMNKIKVMQTGQFIKLMLLIVFFVGILSAETFGQSSRSVEEILKERSARQTSSQKKKKKISLFSKKKKSPNTTDAQLRAEYDQRQKDNAKRNKKEAKLAAKPQYSNPLYFGHKKKPKKRPNGKKKFCKECGLRH